MVVAISDPDDVVALDDVRAATGMVIQPVVAARSELRKLIDRLKRQDSDLGAVAATMRTEDLSSNVSNLMSDGDDGPLVRYVNSLIEQAIQSRASDLHLEPTENDMRVRFRIDGVLHEIDKVPHNVQSGLISRLKIMSNVDITERRLPQNGRITVRLNGRNVDLRTATLPTVWGEKVVLRVLDTKGLDLELKKLGFTDDNYARFSASFHKPHGMVLVTGPTGSGKVDHALRHPDRDQPALGEHHHHRGSGGVPPRRSQPGPGQSQGGLELRGGAAGDPAVGPRHHHDR